MSQPFDWKTIPESSYKLVAAWYMKIGEGYPELVKSAKDTAFHLYQPVDKYLDMSMDDLQENAEACDNWVGYLLTLWDGIADAWQQVPKVGLPQDVVSYDGQSREWVSAAHRALAGLSAFFWSVRSWVDKSEQRRSQAISEYEKSAQDGPNTAPLPNSWLTDRSQAFQGKLVRDVLLTRHADLEQYSQVDEGDLTFFADLARG